MVAYVTHGGQVGAPFDAACAPDCALGLAGGFNNPCIRGEFQHVRHIKKGLMGTFHAASNGKEHDFDSLMCACLDCVHNDTAPCGVQTSNPVACQNETCLNHPLDRSYGTNSLINGLCFDKTKAGCGPFPPAAPANKICFSGVGDYVCTQGKKTENKVVFRVDLEDHSEPGGAHPKGGSPPPDRYRMRMWFIDPTQVSSQATLNLRATVSCKNAATEVIPCTLDCSGLSTPLPDIDDGGDLDRGNRQIHPSTGAADHCTTCR
jgi:hypothetical protein